MGLGWVTKQTLSKIGHAILLDIPNSLGQKRWGGHYPKKKQFKYIPIYMGFSLLCKDYPCSPTLLIPL